jgi:hypothetical protein
MTPLKLTDSELDVIFAAARPLAVQDRDPFLRAYRLSGSSSDP